jgi:hypothetical protein
MKRSLGFVLVLVAFLGTGCAAVPKVHYDVINEPDPAGKIKFVLPRSLIIVDQKRSIEEGQKLVASAVPSDLPVDVQQNVYAIVPKKRLGIETILNVTYIPNSRIISSIGVKIEDNRVKTIAEVGGVIVTSIGFFAAKSQLGPTLMPDQLPVVIDPKIYEKERKPERVWLPLPHNADWFYRIDIEITPRDAIETKTFFGQDRVDTSVFPFSACRDATLYILQAKDVKTDGDLNKIIDKAWVFGLTFADPDYVMTVELPPQGKIDMHTACGVNITSEKTDTASTWAVIGEVIKQATAIKKAYNAIDKGNNGK